MRTSLKIAGTLVAVAPLAGYLTAGLHLRLAPDHLGHEQVREARVTEAVGEAGTYLVEVSYTGGPPLKVRWRPDLPEWPPAPCELEPGWVRCNDGTGWRGPAPNPFPRSGSRCRTRVVETDGRAWLVLSRPGHPDARMEVSTYLYKPTPPWRRLLAWALTPASAALDVALSPVELVATIVFFATYDGPLL